MITRPGPISVLYRNVCSFPFPYNRNSSAKRSVSRRLIRPWFERQWWGVRFARERKYFADRFSGRNFLSKLDPKFSNWATGLLARPYCSPLLFVIFETPLFEFKHEFFVSFDLWSFDQFYFIRKKKIWINYRTKAIERWIVKINK